MLKGHLEVVLLSALKGGPAHGYALIERVKLQSKDVFELAEGTAYPALHRLEAARWVKSTWQVDRATGRRRRVYALTAQGKMSLAERVAQWRHFSRGVNAMLAPFEPMEAQR